MIHLFNQLTVNKPCVRFSLREILERARRVDAHTNRVSHYSTVRRVNSILYQSGRLDWGSGKFSTNSSLQETSLGLVMSPAALRGSPDRIICLQDALRGSSRIPAFDLSYIKL